MTAFINVSSLDADPPIHSGMAHEHAALLKRWGDATYHTSNNFIMGTAPCHLSTYIIIINLVAFTVLITL